MSTIKDVAKYAGVSIATVSKYLNGGNVLDKNEENINEAIEVLDYKVNLMARGLKTNKTMTVGILIPSFVNIFFTTIVSNIENILLQKGYSTIICDYREDEVLEQKKLDFLIKKNVDGIIMVPYGNISKQIQDIIDQETPVVLLDRNINNLNCDVVLTDNINGSYDAVEQLIKRGHKRIGIICGPEKIYTSQERLKGYHRVHEDYSVPIDRDLIKYGDYQTESGHQKLIELLNLKDPPTAVFVTNYEMTLGAIISINENNINIPEELSIIGYDNIQMAQIVRPPLSIVTQPMQEIGETAAKTILQRLRGDMTNFPAIYRLKSDVLIKESVKNIDLQQKNDSPNI